MVMLCCAVSGQLAWSCAITAIWSRSWSPSISAAGTPSQRSCPDSGWYSPATTLASVVLPDPFSPTRATTSPSAISMLTSRSAGSAQPG